MFKLNFGKKWLEKAAKLEEEGGFTGVVGTDLIKDVAITSDKLAQAEDGTTYKVPYTSILDIQPHNNAERLEVATVYGFQVIVGKGRYKVGDKCVYIPIDSILPEKLEKKLFPEDSKIKLNNHRVRQIKIRGLASQGMLIDPQDIADLVNPKYLKDEQDLKLILGVTKYEPPVRGSNLSAGTGPRNKKDEHPLFHKYNGLDNIKWFPNKFSEQDEVVIQEKLHGTNARASKLPFIANTFMKKLKKFLHLTPQTENCYGSNNVEISSKKNYNGDSMVKMFMVKCSIPLMFSIKLSWESQYLEKLLALASKRIMLMA